MPAVGNESVPDETVTADRCLGAQVTLHDGIDSLHRLVDQLTSAVETLEEPMIPSIEEGLDFYAEVRKFEMSLIRRALKFTNGAQNKAAVVLKLKHSTLNYKIKQYRLG
jgi:transcriptional regulator with PAS, ATPase and Fis domain